MKRKLSILGIIIGIAFVIVGVLSIFGVLCGNTSTPNSAPYYYDSGYASFGADYYTYSVNNTAEAASAARTIAYNIGYVADFLVLFCGLASVLFGLMVMCGFGIVLSSCGKAAVSVAVNETSNAVAEEAPVEE